MSQNHKKRVEWKDGRNLQITVDSIRFAKIKAFARITAGGKHFVIELTKNSAKRLLNA
jgi:hypothetical protein